MKKYKWYLSLIIMVIFLMATAIVFGEELSSDNYTIEVDVFSGGGGDANSDNYSLFSIMGQPSAIGISSSAGYSNYGGFIWTLVGVIPACEGDFDGDGDVDGSDLALFASEFGRTGCNDGPPCMGDFNNDGNVNINDLAIFASEYGRTNCPH